MMSVVKTSLAALSPRIRQTLLSAALIAGAVLAALRVGQFVVFGMSPVPLLALPIVVLTLPNPLIGLYALPIVMLNTSTTMRFMGLSALELVAMGAIGITGAHLATRRYTFPRSNLYPLLFAYLGILSIYAIAFRDPDGSTQQLLAGMVRGIAIYLLTATLIRNRREAVGMIVALAVAVLLVLVQVLLISPGEGFSFLVIGRGKEIHGLLGTGSTWPYNQIAPVLLLCALLLPQAKVRLLAALGFAVVVALDMMAISRAGIVDLGLLSLLALPYLFRRGGLRPGLGLLLIGLVIAAPFIFQATTGYDLIAWAQHSMRSEFQTGSSRWHMFLFDWNQFLQHPLLGVLPYEDIPSGASHSYWAMIARDHGLLFLGLNILLFAFFIRNAYRLSRCKDDPILSAIGRGVLISTLLAIWQLGHNTGFYTWNYLYTFLLLQGLVTACLNIRDKSVSVGFLV